MAGVNAGVEVDNGGAVAVPLAEGKVDFAENLAGWCDDDPVPRVGCPHDVRRFVHHDARFGLTAPLGWQIEEFQWLVKFEVLDAVPR